MGESTRSGGSESGLDKNVPQFRGNANLLISARNKRDKLVAELKQIQRKNAEGNALAKHHTVEVHVAKEKVAVAAEELETAKKEVLELIEMRKSLDSTCFEKYEESASSGFACTDEINEIVDAIMNLPQQLKNQDVAANDAEAVEVRINQNRDKVNILNARTEKNNEAVETFGGGDSGVSNISIVNAKLLLGKLE